jgi:hypothetical protein
VLRQAEDVNMPLVKLPVAANEAFKSRPHEHKSLLNAFELENCICVGEC